MLARFRPRRPSHTTVAAHSALFIALGGTAWAAATIGPAQIKNDAVRSRHVKDGEVKNADLGANSVGTGKVINGSLLRGDFRTGELPRGAFSFNVRAERGEKKTLAAINGIELEGYCPTAPVSEHRVGVYIGGNDGILMSGIETSDGKLKNVHLGESHGFFQGYFAHDTQDFDVLVSSGNGKWAHVDVGSYTGGGACNFWGLIIPPSN